MSLITLTTDFGNKDYFVGAVKGAIYSELPTANIVDISHEISPFNITETAYILKNAYRNFPEKTIHIIGVDAEKHKENKHIALLLNNHYFVCADNGLISLLESETNPTKIVEINIHNRIESSFSTLNIFIKVACHLARGGTLEVIGKPIKKLKKRVELSPQVSTNGKKIKGCVIYIDHYGNIITNITKKLFLNFGKNKKFQITIGRYNFTKVYSKYSDIINFSINIEKRQSDGNKMALFNNAGYLEIAIYKSNLKTIGGASSLLGIDYRNTVLVEFL